MAAPRQLNTDHSDTLLVVHIAANRKWADVMSIPRDSWVNIPACRMGNGQLASPQTFKINEAFTLGNLYGNKTALGTACVIKTVESNTHIHIDHFVVVNFDGLKDMVNAVGGVPECNTKPIDDPKSGLHLPAGHNLLNGRQALGYVRARYTLGNGSDLERITRQQAFMSALVSRVKAKELNPIALYRFLDAATRSITIDSQLGGIHGLYDLATSLKNLPPGKVTFFTLPTYPRSYVDPTDTANLLWTQPQDSLIFQAFRNDVPVSEALLEAPARAAPVPVEDLRGRDERHHELRAGGHRGRGLAAIRLQGAPHADREQPGGQPDGDPLSRGPGSGGPAAGQGSARRVAVPGCPGLPRRSDRAHHAGPRCGLRDCGHHGTGGDYSAACVYVRASDG